MHSVIIIPALNPDARLVQLVRELQALNTVPIVVVNDGSGPEYVAVWEELPAGEGCMLLSHTKNQGKGEALKTGIRAAAQQWTDCAGFVTADADGQHSAIDILQICTALEAQPGSLILGTRDFHGSHIPFKSKWGNRITSFIFRLNTGVQCPDTQTGLRGLPAVYMRQCLDTPGSRFEYEMNLLLRAAKDHIPFVPIPIRTIYLEKNKSSHFRPLRDSARIYMNILRFGLSSLTASVVDLGLFTALTALVFTRTPTGLLAATAVARVTSGCLNFAINKCWVFESKTGGGRELVRYILLFCAQLLASWLFVALLAEWLRNLTIIKIFVDVSLFFASYHIQKHLVFRPDCRKNNLKECTQQK